MTSASGLEVQWDGVDSVNILVNKRSDLDLCGLCGNYNGDSHDDWTIGQACPEQKGVKVSVVVL